MNTKIHRKQSGITLVELMLVLGVGLAIIITGLLFYNNVTESQRLNEGVRNLQSVTSAARNMFSSQGDYRGLTEEVVMRASGFPQQMEGPAGDEMEHPWEDSADAVTMQEEDVNSTADAFSITFDNLPQEACVNLASQTYTSYDGLWVDNGVGSDANVIEGVADINTECDEGNNNALTWRVR